jgi:hypothetical protein
MSAAPHPGRAGRASRNLRRAPLRISRACTRVADALQLDPKPGSHYLCAYLGTRMTLAYVAIG